MYLISTRPLLAASETSHLRRSPIANEVIDALSRVVWQQQQQQQHPSSAATQAQRQANCGPNCHSRQQQPRCFQAVTTWRPAASPPTDTRPDMLKAVAKMLPRKHHRCSWPAKQRCSCLMLCIASSLLLLAQPSLTASTFLPHSTARTAAQATPQSSLNLEGIQQLTLIFPASPLSQAPTPPPAYKPSQMGRWEFLGGQGYLLITRHDFGPVGVLSEMMYFPGKFRPKCSKETFYSAQRFWVDMPISQQIGRTIWGFPKELATFEWGSQSVTAKDLQGNVFFSARLSDSLDLQAPLPSWLSSTVTKGLPTLQWPIKDPKPALSSVLEIPGIGVNIQGQNTADADAADAAAAVAGSLLPPGTGSNSQDGTTTAAVVPGATAQAPNHQTLSFPTYDQLVLAQTVRVVADPFAFTGRKKQKVVVGAGGVAGAVLGSPGELDKPVPYACKQTSVMEHAP